LFRCASLCSLSVATEAVSIVKITLALLKSSSADSASELKFLKLPVTFVIIRCLTLKVTSVCAGSNTHFVTDIYLNLIGCLFFVSQIAPGRSPEFYSYLHF